MPLQLVAGGHGEATFGACKVAGEGSQLCSTTCPSPLLPLVSASETGSSPAPSPCLELHSPTLPGPYHPEPIAVTSCHMETHLGSGTGAATRTCMLPWLTPLPGTTGEQVAPHLQCNVCMALGTSNKPVTNQ